VAADLIRLVNLRNTIGRGNASAPMWMQFHEKSHYLHPFLYDRCKRANASEVHGPSCQAKGTVERPGKNVRQKAGLNKEILEVSPGMMISMLRYEAERAGG